LRLLRYYDVADNYVLLITQSDTTAPTWLFLGVIISKGRAESASSFTFVACSSEPKRIVSGAEASSYDSSACWLFINWTKNPTENIFPACWVVNLAH
jgi:hypothetical protein